MEFNPINTQEEFDARVTELYGDVSGLQQQITTLTGERDAHASTIAELQAQIKKLQEQNASRDNSGDKSKDTEKQIADLISSYM